MPNYRIVSHNDYHHEIEVEHISIKGWWIFKRKEKVWTRSNIEGSPYGSVYIIPVAIGPAVTIQIPKLRAYYWKREAQEQIRKFQHDEVLINIPHILN